MAEARRRERHAVRKHLDDLKQATVLHVGRGGWTLSRSHGRLEGHGGVADLFVQAALAGGVAAFDSTKIAGEKTVALLDGSCPAHEPREALRCAEALGARVYNSLRPGSVEHASPREMRRCTRPARCG